jgi:hypothetical protein
MAAMFGLVVSVGCHRNEMATLSGRVTVDGAPLADGTISFESPDNNKPTAGGLVRDGNYALSLLPGPKIVRIQGFKIVGQRPLNRADPHGPMVPTKEQILPETFNAQSTLRFDVGPSGGEKSFELTTHG